jgi:hypothetical protein
MKQARFDITTTITHSLIHDQQNMNKVIIGMNGSQGENLCFSRQEHNS